MKKAAILAAGMGSRLKSITPFKPLTPINGTPLLEITIKNLHFQDFAKVSIIFNEEEKTMDLTKLHSLDKNNIHYFFKTTPSSLHSLYEVIQKLDLQKDEHFFVSMLDSIVDPLEARKFHNFCHQLSSNESGILVTSFIDDEKPLSLKVDEKGYVCEFQSPITQDSFITSGVYCFSEKIVPHLLDFMQTGQPHLRNFLHDLILKEHKIKIFHLSKTLDIDRPEDIQVAARFLSERSM